MSARCSRYFDVFRRHAEKHAQQATSSCQPRLTQTVSPWLILALLRQHTVGDAICDMSNCGVRVTVAAAVRNSRGGTKTASAAAVQVGVCVEMVLIILPGCIKEQIVDAPVLQIQEGVAEQIVDFTVPSIKEVMVEVSRSGAHSRAHRGAKVSRARSRRPSREVFQALFTERIHGHIVEQTVAFCGECGISALAERSHLGAH